MPLTNRRHSRSSRSASRGDTRRDVVLLRDLDPRRDVRGGAGKHLFGAMSASQKTEVESPRETRKLKEKGHDDETQ